MNNDKAHPGIFRVSLLATFILIASGCSTDAEDTSNALAACSVDAQEIKDTRNALKAKAIKNLKTYVNEFNNYGPIIDNLVGIEGQSSNIRGRAPCRTKTERGGDISCIHNDDAFVFLRDNTPYFESPDNAFNEVYAYRWWVYRKHLHEYQDANLSRKVWNVSEFPNGQGHESPGTAIVCPAGLQFYDGRWLRDSQYLRDYAIYWYHGEGANRAYMGGYDRTLSYVVRDYAHNNSVWLNNAVDAFLQVHPDVWDESWSESELWKDKVLTGMEDHFGDWDNDFTVNAKGKITDGMFKNLDAHDCMEYAASTQAAMVQSEGPFSYFTTDNIGDTYNGWGLWNKFKQGKSGLDFNAFVDNGYKRDGQGSFLDKNYPQINTVRPSLNSYMYADLLSMARLMTRRAAELGDTDPKAAEYRGKATDYTNRAEQLRAKILDVLWNDEQSFFKTHTADDNIYAAKVDGDGDAYHMPSYETPMRESVGYVPWYFDGIVPQGDSKYNLAWQQLNDVEGFAGNFGITSVERRSPYFNELAYSWNGRGWPLLNSIIGKSYANFVRNYAPVETRDDWQAKYFDYLQEYVELHRSRGTKETGYEDSWAIGEYYLPVTSTGYAKEGNKDTRLGQMGGEIDYNHSSFNDIIISDLLGFKASHKPEFTIAPLVPENKWNDFYLGNVLYHGREIDVIWKKDWDSGKQGQQPGLVVLVDNEPSACAPSLNSEINVTLAK
ncbi:hypothetical protein QSV34_01715 [Porticoccus sp. W117]|uniref:MGH1-like glycoside hydrolase domain-containing protein n=1 Tax=Porticoccus sp. W117 TaxID=3054777 RepID=UPI002596A1DB|nr:hypothetical protein [Porticoccus sp. W117]MDM3870064.1 hypothetical protein [Porticoccus sp. W117]